MENLMNDLTYNLGDKAKQKVLNKDTGEITYE